MSSHRWAWLRNYRRAPTGLPLLIILYCAWTAIVGVWVDGEAWKIATALATGVGAWFWPRDSSDELQARHQA